MEIDITLPQQAYAVFESLNYNAWNAIGEFIDNSIQSYFDYKQRLKAIDRDYKLRIDINLDNDKLEILDNASGIDECKLKRGLRPATKPENSGGLSEFGMGMKTAAFWICRKWKIITKHFESKNEFTVEFDNVEIYTKDIRKIIAYPTEINNNNHYTKIILEKLDPIDTTNEDMIEDIKSNVTSMYRHYIRDNEIDIYFNNEKLSFKKYDVLVANKVYGKDRNTEIEWKKDIDFVLSSGKRITGFAGLLAKGNPVTAGFSYLRRNRVIQGLVEGIKIKEVLGTANLKKSQRVFAELNLDEFPVSHTKDKILFGTEIYDFWARLKKELDGGNLRLLYQAENCSYSRKKKVEEEQETIESEEEAEEITPPHKPPVNPLEVNLPDFEDAAIEVSGNINKFSGEMKEAYENMYKIENLIRMLIKNVEISQKISFLDEDIYGDLAEKAIIKKINDRIKGIRKIEEENGLVLIRGNHDLYYTGFNALKDIIELNFDGHFSGFFVMKKHILEDLERLYSYRNNIAHNSYLTEDERNFIKLALDRIVKQLSGKIDLAK
jgi:hypothetical protein